MRLPRPVFLLLFALVVGVSATPARAGTIVIPNFNTTNLGNTTDGSDPGLVGISLRLQQLFGPGQFLSIGSPILIDQFSFRPTPGSGSASIGAANVDIFLSTSPRFPNNAGGNPLMSTVFADNVGLDNTLVYSGPLAVNGAGCPAGPNPCPFTLNFTFQTPFLYNPLKGSLLIDLFITDFAASTGELDAVDFSPNFGPVAGLINVAGQASGEFDPGADITQIRFTAVPEPATMTLLLSGLGVAAVRRRNRKTPV